VEVNVSGSVWQRNAWNHFIAIACLVLAAPAAVLQAGEWNGTIETLGDVEYIINPETGMDSPVTFTLKELWRVGGDSESEEEFFGVINQLTADRDGNVYLLDRQLSEVKVFSPNGEYSRTLGREGEGPGEFRRGLDMFFLPNGNLGVLQLAPGRIVMFTPEGEPAGEYPTPEIEGGGTPALIRGGSMGEGVVLVTSENKRREGAIDIHRSLILVDSQGVEQARMLESIRELSFVNFLFDETVWVTFDERWKVGPTGHLYAVDGFLDYEIIEWDSHGNRKRVIKKEYEHRDRTSEQKTEMHDVFDALLQNQLPEYTIRVSDQDADITNIYPRENGSLWVLTSRGARDLPEGALGVFDVFDAAGRFAREVTLIGEGEPLEDGYFFLGDRLFIVTGQLDANIASRGGRKGESDDGDEEEEPEPISIICYKLGTAIEQIEASR
jgi:hypothetical protein